MEREDEFLKRARRSLEAMSDSLDAATTSRLRAARKRALTEGRSAPAPSRWLMPVGGLVAAGTALTVAGLLWFAAPEQPPLPTGLGDIELLTAVEHPEFFSDLEFYEWLERDQSG